MTASRIAATTLLLGLTALGVACGNLGLGGSEGETSFVCQCHESEETADGQPMYVCSENEHGAVAAARKCHGTASNTTCTCTSEKKPCRPSACR